MISTERRPRRPRLSRFTDGPGQLRLLAAAGIVTVLVTRAYLAATGYPQIGGGTLHIAHVLWGGLLMLAGLVTALLFVGGGTRAVVALLGGVGAGLFVDEVGKFVTKTNDYFFRPAAAIVYLVFAALLVLAWWVHRVRPVSARGRLASAAQIAAAGLTSGLTPERRAAAVALLDGVGDEEARRAVRAMLDAAPERRRPAWLRRLTGRPLDLARRLGDSDAVTAVVLGMFVMSQIVVAIVFGASSVVLLTGGHIDPGASGGAVLAGAASRLVTMVLTVIGVVRWFRDRHAGYPWWYAAVLIMLVVAEVFAFHDSQFRGVVELPFLLVVLAVLRYRMRRPGRIRPHPTR